MGTFRIRVRQSHSLNLRGSVLLVSRLVDCIALQRKIICINTFVAYFTEAQETAFGVVNRPWFEARLKAHFVTAEPIDDAAWYALRNAIFAYGYRFAHPDQLSYGKSKDTSWLWFENALSVHSQLIFNRTSLVAVQALIVMVQGWAKDNI